MYAKNHQKNIGRDVLPWMNNAEQKRKTFLNLFKSEEDGLCAI